MRQAPLVPPPPAGGGPVPGPRHATAANLQQDSEYYYVQNICLVFHCRLHREGWKKSTHSTFKRFALGTKNDHFCSQPILTIDFCFFSFIILFLGQSSLMSCLWFGRDKMMGEMDSKQSRFYTYHKEAVLLSQHDQNKYSKSHH